MCKDHGTWVSRTTGHSVMPLWSNHSQVFGHGTAEYSNSPRRDPQVRTWFGPHDRLFIGEESRAVTSPNVHFLAVLKPLAPDDQSRIFRKIYPEG